MNEEQLATLRAAVRRAQGSATTQLNGSISAERTDLLARYYGDLYGDELPNRSDYVDRTVMNVVESIKPELMEIFYSGSRVVEFVPTGAQDVEAADQETDVVNFVVNQMNDGFVVFLSWFHDALSQNNGYVKRYWDEVLEPEVREWNDLKVENVLAVISAAEDEGELEIVEWNGRKDVTADQILNELEDAASVGAFTGDILRLEAEQAARPGEAPSDMQAADDDEAAAVDDMTPTYSLKIRVTPEAAYRYVIENVPPEEVIVASEWTKLSFDDCPFVSHQREMPVSDLVAMGFDRDAVERLASDSSIYRQEKNKRFQNDATHEAQFSAHEPSMRLVVVNESYIRHDADGDGVAELLRVYTGGENATEILTRDGLPAVTPVDRAPFNVLSAMPLPHKHYGTCPAATAMPYQKLQSVFARQMIDNVVGSNNPDVVFDIDAATEETERALQVNGLGRNIPIRGGAASYSVLPPPPIVQQSLAAIEHFRGEAEASTGASRIAQGLEGEELDKTFGGMKARLTQSQKKNLLIARTFAETGVRRLFLDIHDDLRKGPLKRIAMRVRGQFIEVDPTEWGRRDRMAVNVGLGTDNNQEKAAALANILQLQQQFMAMGVVGWNNIYHTLDKLVETVGAGDASQYFMENPPPPQPQPEQPDPQTQAIIAAEQIRAQASMQKAQIDAETDRQKAAMAAQSDQADRMQKQAQFEAEMRQKMAIAQMQRATQLQIAGIKAETEEDKLATNAVLTAAKMIDGKDGRA